MAKWIPACKLRDTDVLEFQGMTLDRGFDGIPINKLTRHRDGRVEVDVTFVDGSRRYKTFGPDEQVMIKGAGTDD
jgi:hypothetical protein